MITLKPEALVTKTQDTNQLVQNGLEKDKIFQEVQELLYKLQSYKSKTYGSSWCKHGEAISVFGNTSRKYDRIESIIKNFIEGKPLPSPESEESLAETVADLGVYCVLWMTWIKMNRPAEYESWVNRIKRALGE